MWRGHDASFKALYLIYEFSCTSPHASNEARFRQEINRAVAGVLKSKFCNSVGLSDPHLFNLILGPSGHIRNSFTVSKLIELSKPSQHFKDWPDFGRKRIEESVETPFWYLRENAEWPYALLQNLADIFEDDDFEYQDIVTSINWNKVNSDVHDRFFWSPHQSRWDLLACHSLANDILWRDSPQHPQELHAPYRPFH